ncbi:MAG: hypothetical protein L0Z53_16750, partial [Acidobacteriales bacterium]|nr:hypothetical protein [Terriglobales bacterium]
MFNPQDAIDYQEKALNKLDEAAHSDLSRHVWGQIEQLTNDRMKSAESSLAPGGFLDLDATNLYSGAHCDKESAVQRRIEQGLDKALATHQAIFGRPLEEGEDASVNEDALL